MPSDFHFATAMIELVEKRPSQGLLARCYSEAEGDEAKARAKYVAMRAKEIEEQEEAAIKQYEQQVKRKESERQKVINSFNFEMFQKEYKREIPLRYYGRKEQQDMFKEWRNRKLREMEA
ncbi:MAG TPA: hypothetical protein VGI03_07920 [Verrucomicrobiae bacterium]